MYLLVALLEVSNDSYIKNLPVFVFDKEENALICMSHINLAAEIRETSISNLNFDLRQNSPKDKILYIYTSGTTGLPKASIITNLRFMFLVMGGYVMLDLKKEDVFYNSLPLYHTGTFSTLFNLFSIFYLTIFCLILLISRWNGRVRT